MSLTTTLPESEGGETFSLNLADFIGSSTSFKSNDTLSEDFLVLNGKHYKLDQTKASFNPKNYTLLHSFKTVDEKYRVFKKRGCELFFEPVKGVPPRDGDDYVFYKFIQDFVYGHFTGTCKIELNNNKIREIKLNKVMGTVEHVSAKW